MKRFLLILVVPLFPCLLLGQFNEATVNLLRRLDSVQRSGSVSRHFAELYFTTTVNAIGHFSAKDQRVQDYMQRLELRFAEFFFEAAAAEHHMSGMPPAWKAYYADTSLSREQYFLLGANAHINADIWKAMTTSFTLAELQDFKKDYFQFNLKLKKELFFVYQAAYASASRVRLLHILSLGLDREYIKWMLVRWRKRQMRLSLLWFTDPKQFRARLSRLEKKMDRFNTMILRQL